MIDFSNPQTRTSRKVWESVDGAIGGFSTKIAKGAQFSLYFLDDHDKEVFKYIKLKPNERLFRFDSERYRRWGYKFLIKINLDSGLLYYMVDHVNDEDIDFETTGVKPLWIGMDDNRY
jgi:hypothetical protein